MGKAFRSGFYWPLAVADTQNLVRLCPGCQFFSSTVMRPNRDIVGRSSREILKSLLSHGVFFYAKTMEEFPIVDFIKGRQPDNR